MTKYEKAIFAGGCFWCLVEPFDRWDGVKSVISGYTGGVVENPTYEQVGTGLTGHREAVEITYDPSKVSYNKLLNAYWQVVDPTDDGGQFQDRGEQYVPVIYYTTEKQKEEALESRKRLEESHKFDKPIVVAIEKAQPFYPAEEYHQDFYKKNPLRYQIEEMGGREQYKKKYWGK